MCTVIVLRRPGTDWPLVLAANRDEMEGRPWKPPARHWPDRPDVTAGLDVEAGGSWMGLNDFGVVAAVLNRHGTLGTAAGKRSRGELVLEALDHAEAGTAAGALRDLNPEAYRPFNMVIADNEEAYWLRHPGDGPIKASPLPEGLSMLTAGELNDVAEARIGAFLPRFATLPPPDPHTEGWRAWETMLGAEGLCFQMDNGFGTRSSALLALPSRDNPDRRAVWTFAAGPPCKVGHEPV